MNSNQLNLITKNKNIQELINRLDCIEHISNDKLKLASAISSRINSWITDFQNPSSFKPSIFNSNDDIQKWIEEQKARHGNNWCPF